MAVFPNFQIVLFHTSNLSRNLALNANCVATRKKWKANFPEISSQNVCDFLMF